MVIGYFLVYFSQVFYLFVLRSSLVGGIRALSSLFRASISLPTYYIALPFPSIFFVYQSTLLNNCMRSFNVASCRWSNHSLLSLLSPVLILFLTNKVSKLDLYHLK